MWYFTLRGEIWTKFGHFHTFFISFLLCPKSFKSAKKFFLVRGEGTPLMCETKFWSFTLFRGWGGLDQKCESSHFFFEWEGPLEQVKKVKIIQTCPDPDWYPLSCYRNWKCNLSQQSIFSSIAFCINWLDLKDFGHAAVASVWKMKEYQHTTMISVCARVLNIFCET